MTATSYTIMAIIKGFSHKGYMAGRLYVKGVTAGHGACIWVFYINLSYSPLGTVKGIGGSRFQSRLARRSMRDWVRLGDSSKSLLESVLKSLGVICPLTLLCCRGVREVYHSGQGGSTGDSRGESTGVSHGNVGNKISRGAIQFISSTE